MSEQKRNKEKERFRIVGESGMICPVCGRDTFQYDETLQANKCQNEFCRFCDKVLPAPDVPMSFLEYCKKNARSEEHRKYIEKVIEATKCSGKK